MYRPTPARRSPLLRLVRMLGAALAACCAIATALPILAAPEGPLVIGEHLRDTVLETPHPYAAAGGSEPRLIWSDHFQHPGSAHLVFEFSRFDLAPGDWVEVRDPESKQVHVYRGLGFKDKGGDFISKMILGDEAYIDLYSVNPTSEHYGYRIERITRGFSPAEMEAGEGGSQFEAICGADDKEDAVCYETAFPDVYEEARAVARIVMDGSALCTAWLVSCHNHVMTNNHCTWDDDDFDTQGELDRMEFQFMYEDATCGGGGATVEYSFIGGTWLENDRNLDYTLIQAPGGENPASTYGWLLLDDRVPDIDELMYIVGHPSGRPKEISLYSGDSSEDNPDGFCEVFSTDEPACVGGSVGEIGYFCDTEGGNSGSPVLSRDTNKVIALHHCANCPNRGTRIPNIWALNQGGSHALPACSLLDDIGAVELDRGSYACSDSVSIEVFDGSIQGQGSQNVTVWSDSEPTPETVTLVESPADSGSFVGSIATVATAAVGGDGQLSVAHGDTITVRYIDADDGQGGINLPREASGLTDCQGPVISAVTAIDIAGTTATVTWNTDEPANSEVDHDTSPPPWTTTVESELVTSHVVELSGLNECSVHEYQVRSSDEAGNTATDNNGGSNHSFETGVDVVPTYAHPGPAQAIADQATIQSVISITQDFPIQDLDVTIDITHTYTGDLDIFLSGPNGFQVELTSDNGGNGADFSGTTFDDEAPIAVTAGSAPFAGSYRPEGLLSGFDGLSVLGDWTLIVTDDASGDVGTLNSWSITPTFPPRACGPHAGYGSHGADSDFCDEGGGGNQDGVWDPGEDVTLRISVANDGTDPLTGVSATITALTPGVTLILGSATFPDIGVGESRDSQAPHFAVSLADGLFCGTALDFQIEITANGETWNDTFSQTLGTIIPGGGIAFAEDFDAAGIPVGWQVVDGGSTSDTWFADDSTDPAGCANTDPAPPLGGTWAAVDSDCPGEVDMDESLITPVIDLSSALTATLEFDHYFNVFETELADVDVRSSLTGGSWVNVAQWSVDSTNPALASIDITPQAAGASDVEIRWHYYGANFAWYWYVDNVRVSITAPGGCDTLPCGLSSAPAAQAGSRFLDGNTLTWDSDPGATHGYTVYRGTRIGLGGLTGPANDSCERFVGTHAADNVLDLSGDNPTFTLGRMFWYLVTGWNAIGEGPAGDGASGPRQVNASGACP